MPTSSGSASSLIFASSATAAAVFAACRIYRWSSGRSREAENQLHDRADKVWYMHIENKRKHIGILPVDVACNVAMSGRIHSPRSQVLFKKFSADCFDSK